MRWAENFAIKIYFVDKICLIHEKRFDCHLPTVFATRLMILDWKWSFWNNTNFHEGLITGKCLYLMFFYFFIDFLQICSWFILIILIFQIGCTWFFEWFTPRIFTSKVNFTYAVCPSRLTLTGDAPFFRIVSLQNIKRISSKYKT